MCVGGGGLFMVMMTLVFPVEESVGELVRTAGNEETSAGEKFPVTS